MKTLHLDTGREMGGGQWQVLYLMERLKDATLMAPEGSPLREHFTGRIERLSFRNLRKRARDFEMVHAHDARAHGLAVMARAAMAGIAPLVVSRRVGFPVKRTVASRWKYARADGYFAVSKFVATRLESAGVSSEKIRVIYDGVPIPKPSHPQPGRVVALSNKGARIVQAAANSLRIPIQMTSDLWQDLSTASIFLYVSEMEGLGSAALAAMACGVPVIASGVGGLPEIVEHERTGLIVKNDELEGALRRLLNHPTLAAEMGRRGRDRVIGNFSVEKMVARTERAYQEILGC